MEFPRRQTTAPAVLLMTQQAVISKDNHQPEYRLSAPLDSPIAELSLSISASTPTPTSTPIYKLTDLDTPNAVYIAAVANNPSAYPGFGELKLRRGLLGLGAKVWELKYDDGERRVLVRKEVSSNDGKGGAGAEQRDSGVVAVWSDANGAVVATEESHEEIRGDSAETTLMLRFPEHQQYHQHQHQHQQQEEGIRSLVVAAWVACEWWRQTSVARAEHSKSAAAAAGSGSSSRSGRRDMNRFVGNLFSSM